MRRRGFARRTVRWLDLTVVGIQFPVAMGIGYVWGRAMDRWFGTWPWLTLAFFLFGTAAGFVNLFRMTSRAAREEDTEQGGGDG